MNPNQEIVELKYFEEVIGKGKFKEGEMHYVSYEIELSSKKMTNPFMYQLVCYLLNSNSVSFLIGSHLKRGIYLSHSNFCVLINAMEFRLIKGETILFSGGSRGLYEPFSMNNDCLFFYKTKHPFSQWYKCKFTLEGIEFSSAEQYMMYKKAKLFSDSETAQKIMNTSNPREQKDLGRLVKGFNKEEWNKNALEIVYDGNLAKFSQNEDLMNVLLSTKGQTIVEASPYDKIWGIGLSEDNTESTSPINWQGTNWLGIVLTELRQEILSKGEEDYSTRPNEHFYWVGEELNEALKQYYF